ncbi:MAG TPA: S9 family peptidase [Anaeromyxobacteraceae bacterium]|nr:S9 family peptidase [Anaeromyxobacteraceae bacterium]
MQTRSFSIGLTRARSVALASSRVATVAALVAALPAAAQQAPAPAGAASPAAPGAASAAASAAPAPRPFTVQDLVTLRRVSDPRVSPDGKWVVYVLRSTDLEANRGRTDIWMVGVDGKGGRRLTTSPENDSAPRWAPDGRSIYFLSARGGAQQVWRLRLDGGEAERVTSLPLDVSSFQLSPDGKQLVVSASVFPDCAGAPGGVMACTLKRLDERARSRSTGRLYTQLPVRHWDEWLDGRRNHLFAVPVAGGEPVDLMKGMEADSPSRPFGGAGDFAFTPDGKGVVFAAKDAGRAEAWSTNFDLWLVPLDGVLPPRNLTPDGKAWDGQPVFSPDGRTLAWLSMEVPGYEADRHRILVRGWPDGPVREVAPDWDRSPAEIVWSPDGRSLLATADHLGTHSLFQIDLATGKVRTLVGHGSNHAPRPATGGTIVYQHDDLSRPADLLVLRADGTESAPITQVNAEALAGIAFGEKEQFTFPGWNGETVHAWIVKPPGLDPAAKVPVAFLIHGGPQGSFGDQFHYRWNPQIYAAAGYAAVMVDFHGSTGYGRKFTDSIGGDWGGKPLEDLQKGLAAAVRRYPFLDGTRVAALGASYGGYMIDWIAGAWPDRFRCLVNHDGNLDEFHAYFDTEELWFPEREHGGTPWQVPQAYQKHNPVNLVKNWKTPILVIHGGRDYRVVDTQGLSSFTAAQRMGVPSEFLHFPDENHWVLKPANSIQWHETVLRWIDRWTRH